MKAVKGIICEGGDVEENDTRLDTVELFLRHRFCKKLAVTVSFNICSNFFFLITDALSPQFIPVRDEEYGGSNDIKLRVIC